MTAKNLDLPPALGGALRPSLRVEGEKKATLVRAQTGAARQAAAHVIQSRPNPIRTGLVCHCHRLCHAPLKVVVLSSLSFTAVSLLTSKCEFTALVR